VVLSVEIEPLNYILIRKKANKADYGRAYCIRQAPNMRRTTSLKQVCFVGPLNVKSLLSQRLTNRGLVLPPIYQ
jgi:hypothetical protein